MSAVHCPIAEAARLGSSPERTCAQVPLDLVCTCSLYPAAPVQYWGQNAGNPTREGRLTIRPGRPGAETQEGAGDMGSKSVAAVTGLVIVCLMVSGCTSQKTRTRDSMPAPLGHNAPNVGKKNSTDPKSTNHTDLAKQSGQLAIPSGPVYPGQYPSSMSQQINSLQRQGAAQDRPPTSTPYPSTGSVVPPPTPVQTTGSQQPFPGLMPTSGNVPGPSSGTLSGNPPPPAPPPSSNGNSVNKVTPSGGTISNMPALGAPGTTPGVVPGAVNPSPSSFNFDPPRPTMPGTIPGPGPAASIPVPPAPPGSLSGLSSDLGPAMPTPPTITTTTQTLYPAPPGG